MQALATYSEFSEMLSDIWGWSGCCKPRAIAGVFATFCGITGHGGPPGVRRPSPPPKSLSIPNSIFRVKSVISQRKKSRAAELRF
jgi:hypothetical protein